MKSIGNILKGQRTHAEIWIVLVVIIMLVGYYYVLYIPNKEQRFIEQKFRSLSRIDKNIHNKIESYEKYLESYVGDEYMRTWLNDTKIDPSNNIALDQKNDVRIQFVNTFHDHIKADSLEVILDTLNRKIEAVRYSKQELKSKNYNLRFSKSIGFRDFVAPLLTKDLFDNYLVLSDKQLLYESVPFGFSFSSIDSIYKSKDNIRRSGMRDMQIGGTNYKMFIQPVGIVENDDIVVIGLLSSESFNSQVRLLPEHVVTPLLYILLSIILLFPILKLLMMGKTERLKFSDLVLSFFALMLLFATTVLIMCRYSSSFEPEEHQNLKVITSQIEKNFLKEIRTAYHQVSKLDSLVAEFKPGEKKWGLTNVGRPNIGFERDSTLHQSNPDFLNEVKQSLTDNFIHISQAYWMDSTGVVKINWTENENNPPFGSSGQRDYFKKINDREYYYLDNCVENKYYLEPLISWSDRQYKLVVSIPSSNPAYRVAGISCYFNSVIDPILPEGLGFVFINNQGEVIAHTNPLKNLSENFYNESDAQEKLSSIFLTSEDQTFALKYGGKEYIARAHKVLNLPYVMLVLEDQSFCSSRYTTALFYSLILFGAILSILILELIVLSYSGYRRSILKRSHFNFEWVFPRTSQRPKYWMIFFANLGITLMLCFIFYSVAKGNVFLILQSFLLSIFISTLFFCLVVCENKRMVLRSNENARLFILVLVLLISIVFVNTLNKPNNNGAFLTLMLSVLLTTGICFLSFYLVNKNISSVEENYYEGHGHYRRAFSLVVYSRILLTCGMPVMFAYCSGYNKLIEFEVKEKLFAYAKNIDEYKDRNIDKSKLPLACSFNPPDLTGAYSDDNWISTQETAARGYCSPQDTLECQSDELQEYLFRKASHIGYNRKRLWFQQSHIDSVCHSSIIGAGYLFYKEGDVWALKMRGSNQSICSSEDSVICVRTTPAIWYQLPGFKKSDVLSGIIFWIVFFFIHALLFHLLEYIVEKFFGKLIIDNRLVLQLKRNFLQHGIKKLIFIQGPPGSGKVAFVKEHLMDDSGKVYEFNPAAPGQNAAFIDLFEIPDKSELETLTNWKQKIDILFSNTTIKCFVIDHFEYNIRDANTNRIKLNLLEKFLLDPQRRKIIIISTIDIAEFIYSLEYNAPLIQANKEIIYEDIHRWRVLLGNFANLYLPLSTGQFHKPVSLSSSRREILEQECSSIKFMQALKQELQLTIHESADKKRIKISASEELILQIQGLANHFYQYLWTSLTREEQIILIDIAEDGISNTTNFGCLKILLDKGIIRTVDGRLHLFNLSFRNFILSTITCEERDRIVEGINDRSSWSNYKYPIGIIAATLIWILLYSDPDKFGNILPTLTALGTGVPVLLKVFTMFRTGEAK